MEVLLPKSDEAHKDTLSISDIYRRLGERHHECISKLTPYTHHTHTHTHTHTHDPLNNRIYKVMCRVSVQAAGYKLRV